MTNNHNKNKKNVVILGLGYVGLPLALLASKNSHNVVGIDLSTEKVNLINQRRAPFLDSLVDKELATTSMRASTDAHEIAKADIIIVCVPTPIYENKLPDYRPVESACASIAAYLKRGQLIILESTVNPGVCEEIILPILERETGLKCGVDFFLAHCPERINPGDKKWNVSNIPRVVGGFCQTSLDLAIEFYRSIIGAEIKPMNSLKEAEAVKVVENSFRNINIAFVNELAMSFDKLGIDVVNVIDGAATKPFAFMPHYPGCGIGGHCIPVDPHYLIDYAKKYGFEHKFLSIAHHTNEFMPEYTVSLAEIALKNQGISMTGTKVAVLGLSYKANIDDCRESPSFEIIKNLEKRGAQVATFDPYVLGKSTAKTMDEAISGAQAVIFATSHKAFVELPPEYFVKNGVKVIIDGRNFLPKEKFIEAGIIFKGIGR